MILMNESAHNSPLCMEWRHSSYGWLFATRPQSKKGPPEKGQSLSFSAWTHLPSDFNSRMSQECQLSLLSLDSNQETGCDSHMGVQSSWIDRSECLLKGRAVILASQLLSRPVRSSFVLGVRVKCPHSGSLIPSQHLELTQNSIWFWGLCVCYCVL